MRIYPKTDYDKEALAKLNADPWMVELLKCNCQYPWWSNYEDYMAGGTGWDKPAEIEDISKLWTLDELNEAVNFYFEICRDNHTCKNCDGSGLNKETKQISDDWYDFGNTGKQWCYNITQDEADALWEHGRLKCDFDEKPTSAQVNMWARKTIGHDSINRHICVETRAKRLGVYGYCECCNGDGIIYDEEKAHLELQLWFIHPRKGSSRGLRVKQVLQQDVPKVVEYLQEARRRNDERFSGLDNIRL